MEYGARPPVFISFEEAAEDKLCSHCGCMMEIRQISLTEAVRQCFRCSTPFYNLEEDDIQYIHRSYEDIGKSPKDWKKCFTQHEEELEKIQKWFKQQNELLAKYLDSDEEDLENEDCLRSKSSEQQKLLVSQPENESDLLDILNSFGPIGTLDNSQNLDFSWLDDFDNIIEPNQKHKPLSPSDTNNEQCSGSYKELSFEAGLSTDEQSVFLELCSSLGETLSNKFSSLTTPDCNGRQVRPESEESHLPEHLSTEFQPPKSLTVSTGEHCPAYDTPNSGDVHEEYRNESEPTSESVEVSLDHCKTHQETSVEKCVSSLRSEEPIPLELLPTVDVSGALSGHCSPNGDVTHAECRPENNSSSASLPSLNTETELDLPSLVRLSFAVDFDSDADYDGTIEASAPNAIKEQPSTIVDFCSSETVSIEGTLSLQPCVSLDTDDLDVSEQSVRVDCLDRNTKYTESNCNGKESPLLQFSPEESTPASNTSNQIVHPDRNLISSVCPLEIPSSFLCNSTVSPSRDPDYIILEIGKRTSANQSCTVRTYRKCVKRCVANDKKVSSFQLSPIDSFDDYQLDHLTQEQISECTMESPLPHVPSTYCKLNIMPKYFWIPKKISSHMESGRNVTQSVGIIPQNTNNEETNSGSCIPITIKFGNFTSTISVPSGKGSEPHLLSPKNPSGTTIIKNRPNTSSDMWAKSAILSEMNAENMPQCSFTSTEILPSVPAISRPSRNYGAKKVPCNRTTPLASTPISDALSTIASFEKPPDVSYNVSSVQEVNFSKVYLCDEDSGGDELKSFTGAKFKPRSERKFVTDLNKRM